MSGGNESFVSIDWVQSGFVLVNGNYDTTAMLFGYPISGLSPITNYDFYVQAICGVGDTSYWAGPFTFSTPPSCPKPTALAASNITPTSADITWTVGGTESNWNFEYGPVGYNQVNGTPVAVTTNSYSLTGLPATTTYDVYVQADGGSGAVSTGVGPSTVTPPCGIAGAPYF